MVICGDNFDVLSQFESDWVDSVVTDPPYGLSFMGKGWDHGVPGVKFWEGVLRVSKPGAYLLAFGGTRTFHRLTCAIEDAGWEIRDCVMWVYGSGFPKSHNIGNGWGTALKPAWEPIIVARKPIVGTVADNVLRYGTGAMNIDGCRVAGDVPSVPMPLGGNGSIYGFKNGTGRNGEMSQSSPLGRWPANLIHDGSDEVVGLFPKGSTTGHRTDRSKAYAMGNGSPFGSTNSKETEYTDSGSAARFFYCAKASKADRDEGCEGLPLGEPPASARSNPAEGRKNALGELRRNHHPTVKPTALMRYLCKLVTPPGGTVLDPFMGSGSTGKAAALEGFKFIGIELEKEYAEIAERRIGAVQPLFQSA